jgi:hypothetical protein
MADVEDVESPEGQYARCQSNSPWQCRSDDGPDGFHAFSGEHVSCAILGALWWAPIAMEGFPTPSNQDPLHGFARYS